ncbi:host attachment protein [Gammaproteobacteria bacterium]|nr:host attachment protein [Gammaproteobacteria bacterium]
MKSTWVLVSDKSQARIFSVATPSSELLEIETLQHPEGRMHEQELDSDLPGKNKSTSSGAVHTYQNEISPKEQETIYFAKEISLYLNNAFNSNKFESLLIISAPSFLGTLRQQLPEALNKSIIFSLDKNLTTFKPKDIRSHLPMPIPQLGS